MDSIKLQVLEELWRKDPQSRVFLRLAEELRKAGQYERAVSICKEGLPNHRSYVPALVSLGRSTQALGQQEEALSVYNKVLSLAPDNTHALRGLGQIKSEQGHYLEAQSYLETLLLHEPNDEEVRERLEEIRILLESDDTADEVVQEVESDPELAVDDDPQDVVFLDSHVPEGSSEQDDSLANLDVEFEKAIEETDQDADLFQDDSYDLDVETTEVVVPVEQRSTGPQNETLDQAITRGLKHEKMEHLEASKTIYTELLEKHPDDFLVKEHLDRVLQLLASETPNQKKIRLLSNWLDKIKGVYHVP